MAVGAADLAWQLVLDRLIGRVVPLQIVVAVEEVDVVLVEDGGPLERSSYRNTSAVSHTSIALQNQNETYRAVFGTWCSDKACYQAAPLCSIGT